MAVSPVKGVPRWIPGISGEDVAGLKHKLLGCLSVTVKHHSSAQQKFLSVFHGWKSRLRDAWSCSLFPFLPLSAHIKLELKQHELKAAFSHCCQFLDIYFISAVRLPDQQKQSLSPVFLCHKRLWCSEQLPDRKALRCSSYGGSVLQSVKSETYLNGRIDCINPRQFLKIVSDNTRQQ